MSRPFRANSGIVDPTDLLDPTNPSEKPTKQTEIPLAIPSVKAATPIKKFSWLFVYFVVKKS
jgi:hypothetical protein